MHNLTLKDSNDKDTLVNFALVTKTKDAPGGGVSIWFHNGTNELFKGISVEEIEKLLGEKNERKRVSKSGEQS